MEKTEAGFQGALKIILIMEHDVIERPWISESSNDNQMPNPRLLIRKVV